MSTISYGAQQIALERKRQIEEEGHSLDHDDTHYTGELVRAAICYAKDPRERPQQVERPPMDWPFERGAWKATPADRERELVKAGAFIAAEVDRLHRKNHPQKKS